MNLFKKRDRKPLSPEDAALLLQRFSAMSVKTTLESLKGHIDEQHLNREVRIELTLFSWFAVDYWVSQSFLQDTATVALRDALYMGWIHIGVENDSVIQQARQTTIENRFKAYAEVLNTARDDTAKFALFGSKLSEFANVGGDLYILMLAPRLFTAAMIAVDETIEAMRKDRMSR